MRVALIHDHLAQDGGAEKVLKILAEIFPEADIYTLLYEKNNANKYFKGRKIDTSVIQKLPGGVKHYQWYMPFMPMAVEFFDLTSYDLVISDTSSFAKGVITLPNTLHVCYCHTPTRYLWSDMHSYIKELKYNKYFKKVIAFVLNYVRMWDKLASERVDFYIANSNFIKRRIKKYYRRDSDVIYPPVETNKFFISKNENVEKYFLAGGRLVPYKRFDLIIEAFKNFDFKLKIFGDGPDIGRLKNIASKNANIEFLGRVSEEDKAKLYSDCEAFIHPQEEDFGITVVEAMASGRPVIAYKSGGAIETIIENKTGIFFDYQTVDSLVDAIKKFNTNNFNPLEIKNHAEQFSVENFKKNIKEFVDKTLDNFKTSN